MNKINHRMAHYYFNKTHYSTLHKIADNREDYELFVSSPSTSESDSSKPT